jgi:S-DNA-T family DNA segregation ATPase FtsK/SpoIIIE
MLEQRDLKLDLVALGLLALTVFLAASLFSYHAADPPARLVYPPSAEPANVCGRSGAEASAALFTAFGVGAYYLLASLAVLDSLLLARRPIKDPLLRLAGWLISLLGISTLSAMAMVDFSPGPVIGAGGYLGAAGRGFLEANFASVGGYILVTSLILGGLLLSTDYVLIQLLAWTIGSPAKGVGRGIAKVGSARSNRASAKAAKKGKAKLTDLDELGLEEDEEDEEQELSIRIAGRPAAEDAGQEGLADEEEDDEEEVDEEEEAEEDSAEEEPKRGLSLLRIRKPRKSKREELLEEIEAAAVTNQAEDYEMPGLDLLLESEPYCFDEQEKDVRRKAKILEKTFADFGFNVRVVEIQTGPVIAQFEVALEAGLRLSKITGLADDLAIALRVPSVRIVAPIPGKNTVGIEVPNAERQLVRLREVIEEANGKAQAMRIPIFLGKDVSGNPMMVDLTTMPHLLIAGRTGTGKSVCLNSIIVSMLMSRRPDEVRMLLIDPKMVELSPYKQIPHLMHPVVTDMRKAEAILAWAVEKMEERYQLLARAGVRHLSVYNQLGEEELKERIMPEDDDEWAQIPRQMPYIVIVADEMADMMMTAAKEVEAHIIRLAQKSRAVGIHLVLATQKPTVDVITGLIKSNLPARICFEVSSRTDSRVVLDEMGADKLLGNGDLLFLRPGTSTLIRGQGTYLSDDEITQVIAAVATTEPQFVKELVQLKMADEAAGDGPQLNSRDELYEAAIDVVVREGRGSVSLLQRALGIGYGRAARLIDYMAEDGFVGTYNGSQAREVTISIEDWEAMHGRQPEPEPPPKPKRRSNKILLEPPAEDPSDLAAAAGPSLQTSTAQASALLNEVPFEADDVEYEEEEEDYEEEEWAEENEAEEEPGEEVDEEDEYDEEEEEEEEEGGYEEEVEFDEDEDEEPDDEEYEEEEDD